MRPDPPHGLRLYPIMSFAEGRLQVSHKFEHTFSDVNDAVAHGRPCVAAIDGKNLTDPIR